MAKNNSEQISLNKYISSSGFCSRREADKLIEQARVTVNDNIALPGARIDAGDVVEIDGEPIKTSKKAIYIALNKPVGITSTTDTKDRSNIISFINHTKRIFPIGRLDKDSDGLILLTNDGDIVNKVLRASNNHEKEYIVTVDKAVTPEFIKAMGNGVPVLDTVTKKCFVRQEGNRKFRIILTQGLNRQIRRMCEYLGYKVMTLTRTRVMNITLDNLTVGKWRYLTPQEVDKINMLVATSSKTEEASYVPKENKQVRKQEKNKPQHSAPEAKKQKQTPAKRAEKPADKTSSKKHGSYKDFKNRKKR